MRFENVEAGAFAVEPDEAAELPGISERHSIAG